MVLQLVVREVEDHLYKRTSIVNSACADAKYQDATSCGTFI